MATAASADTPDTLPGRSRRRLDPHVADVVLAFVLTAVALIGLVLMPPDTMHPTHRVDVLGVVLLVAIVAAIAFLHFSPEVAFATVGVACCVVAALNYPFPILNVGYIAGAIALFVVALHAPVWRSLLATAFASVVLLIVYGFEIPRGGISYGIALLSWLGFTAVWLAGSGYRIYRENVEEARERARRERERAELYRQDLEMHTQEAIGLERSRMARELHDSVGHALNVVVVQAGAARRVFDKKPDAAREALGSIEDAGRQALADIERMLGILRADDSDAESMYAQRGMAQLEPLIDQVREAGLPVEYAVMCGAPVEFPASVDLSVYRIVQEGLTNVLKHAGPGATASVRVECVGDWLEVEVTDDGGAAAAAAAGAQAPGAASPAVPPGPVPAGGRGLIGMRERILLFGGELQVGPRPEGGYRVLARIPLSLEKG